jgi:hypothetical protein
MRRVKSCQAGAGKVSWWPPGSLLSRTAMAGLWAATSMQLPFWPL